MFRMMSPVIWPAACLLIGGSVCLVATVASFTVDQESDDGTEVNTIEWFEDGLTDSTNYAGRSLFEQYGTGFRFHVDDLSQGEEFTYARLRLASLGSDVTSSVRLLIEGVLQDSPTTFSQQERPSQKNPKTRNRIEWEIDENWDDGNAAVPLYYSSPDIAPILNEILALPGWGTGPEGKTLMLTMKDASSPSSENYVAFEDFGKLPFSNPPVLEVYRSVYDAMIGKECLGRVTDTSVTVTLYSLIEMDVFIEYGTSPGVYPFSTPHYVNQPVGEPIDITLDSLAPDTAYYYRLRYRKARVGSYQEGAERSFHTQRPEGSTFSFAVQADEHLQNMCKHPKNEKDMALYKITLQNMADLDPDFMVSMGDFANTEFYTGRNAENLQEAMERYLMQRSYIDAVTHSIPFYLVIGNHEGEQGWYYYSGDDDARNLSILSSVARKAIIPNPYPDGFYSGNTEYVPEYGLREDYYAWEWGDALFVVLNPFWYTTRKPHRYPPGSGGSDDGWDWTLGKEQYDWLYSTLNDSTAKRKFVFTHHLTSSSIILPPDPNYFKSLYGRGGIEVAKYKVDGNASFEWGGEDEDGIYVFDQKRPGWSHGAVHDMLVDADVDIVFHGHDHFFAKQDLDGIVYQECPQPGNSDYDIPPGFKKYGKYTYGDFLPCSGHIHVYVFGDHATVEYVRAYLPGDGNNGEVAYSYTIF